MTTYRWPTDNSRARAVSIVPYTSGLLIPLWPNAETWRSDGTTVSPSAAYSLASTCGFGSAAIDGASGAWLCQYAGSLLHLTSGGTQTTFTLASGSTFVGTAYVSSYNRPYVISANGRIYTTSGAALVDVGGYFGRPYGAGPYGSGPYGVGGSGIGHNSWFLATSGTTLFSINAPASLGSVNLTSAATGVTGSVAIPINNPLCLAATSGRVAVGGWNYAALGSSSPGITGIVFNPLISSFVVLRPSAASIDLYSGSSGIWSYTSTLSGLGMSPYYGAWNNRGNNIVLTDPISGIFKSITYSLGALSVTQTLAIPQAGPVIIMPDNATSFVCRSASNLVTQLTISGVTWSGVTHFSVSNPSCIVVTSASGFAVGSASSLSFFRRQGAAWSNTSTVSLPYTPTSLATDLDGNVFATGASGGAGYMTPFTGTVSGTSIPWTGGSNGIVFCQDQVVVSDQVSQVFRYFGIIDGQYESTGATSNNLTNVIGLAISPRTINSDGGVIFALTASGSGLMYLNQFVGPYNLVNVPMSAVSVLSTGGWLSTTFGQAWDQVTAVTFDSSGRIQAATRNNYLYTLSTSAVVTASAVVPVYSGQVQSTTLGISSMLFALGKLWGVSSLNGSLIELA